MLCYYILFYSILCCFILFYSILFYVILGSAILFYARLCYSILGYSILFYAILFYSLLCYSRLFYAILFYSPRTRCHRAAVRATDFTSRLFPLNFDNLQFFFVSPNSRLIAENLTINPKRGDVWVVQETTASKAATAAAYNRSAVKDHFFPPQWRWNGGLRENELLF